MLIQESIQTNERQTSSRDHVRPDYGLYNFANIPGTILNLLGVPAPNRLPAGTVGGVTAVDKVIFLLIDGFGWNLYERLADSSGLLRRIRREGTVAQLTSQFPSTTTAHVTTMNTNQAVGSHGMFEWNYYEPAADAVIMPLMYAYAGDEKRDTLMAADLDAAALFPQRTLYGLLAEHGVAAHVFSHQGYANSPYNWAMDGMAAGRHAYDRLPQALAELSQAVLTEKGRAYFYLHWGAVDSVSHDSGPFADETLAALRATLDVIEDELVNALAAAERTLLLIGADHGQDAIDPARTIYLNHLLPDIAQVFRTTAGGRQIVPGGSARDFFLYIKDDALEETQALLSAELAGTAEVRRVAELIDEGYFGRPVSEAFLARVGNLVILPNTGESVWWYEANRFGMPFKGHHGGLSTNEMLTPLMALCG